MADGKMQSPNTLLGGVKVVGNGVSGELLSKKLFRVCLELQRDFERQVRGIRNIEKLKLAQLVLEFEAMNHRKEKLNKAREKLIKRKQELADMGFHSEADLLTFQIHSSLKTPSLFPSLTTNGPCGQKCPAFKVNHIASCNTHDVFPVTHYATSDASPCHTTMGDSETLDDTTDNFRYGRKLLRRQRQGEPEYESTKPSGVSGEITKRVYIKSRPLTVEAELWGEGYGETCELNDRKGYSDYVQNRIRRRLLEDLSARRHHLDKRVIEFLNSEKIGLSKCGVRSEMRMRSAP